MVLGFHNYTPWAKLTESAAPHLLYGQNLLGGAGKYWMTMVAALAVTAHKIQRKWSSNICQGMAKEY